MQAMAAMEGAIREMVREEVLAAVARATRDESEIRTGKPSPVDEFVTTAEAARVASVSVGTVRNWLSAGKLTRHGHGRLVRIRRLELLAFLAQPRRGAPLSPEQRASKILLGGK